MADKKETLNIKSGKTKDNNIVNTTFNLERVLVNPRVTEKATIASERDVYVFDVAKDSNKFKIKEAIEFFYKVTPVKINIVTVPAKNIIYRGKKGVKSGGKKAYVYLKEGDKINIV